MALRPPGSFVGRGEEPGLIEISERLMMAAQRPAMTRIESFGAKPGYGSETASWAPRRGRPAGRLPAGRPWGYSPWPGFPIQVPSDREAATRRPRSMAMRLSL